jgi:hypothetical protein
MLRLEAKIHFSFRGTELNILLLDGSLLALRIDFTKQVSKLRFPNTVFGIIKGGQF